MMSLRMGVDVRKSYSTTPLSLPVVANTSASACKEQRSNQRVTNTLQGVSIHPLAVYGVNQNASQAQYF